MDRVNQRCEVTSVGDLAILCSFGGFRVELLQVMEAEVDFPPYFYTLGEIGHRGQMDIPKRDHLGGVQK